MTQNTDPTMNAITRANVGKLAIAMLIALCVLGVLNAAALERYMGDFSGSVLAEEALIQVSAWNELMQQWGLNAPREIVREHVEAFRALRFGDD